MYLFSAFLVLKLWELHSNSWFWIAFFSIKDANRFVAGFLISRKTATSKRFEDKFQPKMGRSTIPAYYERLIG